MSDLETSESFSPESSDVYCLPILTLAAMSRLARRRSELSELARFLEVRVRPGDRNPWGLAASDGSHPAGVTLNNAAVLLPEWFRQELVPITFHFEPIESMPWGDPELHYADLAHETEVFVGAALDWKVAMDQPGSSLHVVEIVSYRGSKATVRDHTQTGFPEFVIPIARFERAMWMASGGFLIYRKVDA